MASGVYHYADLSPTGRIPVVTMQQGQLWTRQFAFICNGGITVSSPFDMALFSDSAGRVGADGVFLDTAGNLYAGVNEMDSWYDTEEVMIQPLGRRRRGQRVTGFTPRLQFTEIAWQDAKVLLSLLQWLLTGVRPTTAPFKGDGTLNFMATMYDNTDQRIVVA